MTTYRVLRSVSSATKANQRCPHLRQVRLHLDTLWWTAGTETSEREVYRRATCALVSSAKPTTGVQVERACRPRCLNSLTPGAHRAGPLHPRCVVVGCCKSTSEARARVRAPQRR
jgi:hypothetical protein